MCVSHGIWKSNFLRGLPSNFLPKKFNNAGWSNPKLILILLVGHAAKITEVKR